MPYYVWECKDKGTRNVLKIKIKILVAPKAQ